MKAVFVGGELSGMTLDVADPSPQFFRNLVIYDGTTYVETYKRRDFVHPANPHVVFRSEYVLVECGRSRPWGHFPDVEPK